MRPCFKGCPRSAQASAYTGSIRCFQPAAVESTLPLIAELQADHGVCPLKDSWAPMPVPLGNSLLQSPAFVAHLPRSAGGSLDAPRQPKRKAAERLLAPPPAAAMATLKQVLPSCLTLTHKIDACVDSSAFHS
jgi:hypothetical protein